MKVNDDDLINKLSYFVEYLDSYDETFETFIIDEVLDKLFEGSEYEKLYKFQDWYKKINNINNQPEQIINNESSFKRRFSSEIENNSEPLIVEVDNRLKYVINLNSIEKTKIY